MRIHVNNDNSKCVHRKIYEEKMFLTNPPKIRWNCVKCKLSGYEIIELR